MTSPTPPATVAVVNQTYRECLKVLFQRDYYQAFYDRTIKYSRAFDYSIGLGSAMSGGTGLGILADPRFAWVCGIMTTVSVLLSIAKGVWDWPGQLKFGLDRVQFYSGLHARYESLVDDINVACQWTNDFEKRRNELRSESGLSVADPYPQLDMAAKRAIQDAIKARVPYTTWWEWRS